MERQLPQPCLSSGERIALDAAMADLCHGGQASTLDKGRPATPAGDSCDIVCCGIAHHSH